MSAGVPTPEDAQIEASIVAASSLGLAGVAVPGRHPDEARYVVKYTTAQHGGRYPPSPNAAAALGIFVSPSPGFTWGPGAYVCPVAYPISTAIYGRCGIVAETSPTNGWRIFDATQPSVAQLYVLWVQRQPLYPMLTLTTHANWANHLMRSLFKVRFAIDVVVFPPDEFHARYTQRTRDRWLAISEWSAPGRLASGVPSSRLLNPRLTILLGEEFVLKGSGIRRQALLGPTPHLASMEPSPIDVIREYRASNMLLVGV